MNTQANDILSDVPEGEWQEGEAPVTDSLDPANNPIPVEEETPDTIQREARRTDREEEEIISPRMQDTLDFLGDIALAEPGAQVRVYRQGQNPTTGETLKTPSFMFAFTVGTKSYTDLMTILRDRYKGGEFYIAVRGTGPRRPWLKRTVIMVEGPPKGDLETSGGADILKMVNEIVERSEQRNAALLDKVMEQNELLRQNTSAQPSPIAMLKETAELLKSLMPPPAAPVTVAQPDPFDGYAKFMELRRALREEFEESRPETSDGGVNWLEAIKAVPQILETMRKPGAAAGIPSALPNPAAPLPAENITPSQPQPTGASTMKMSLDDLSPLNQLFQGFTEQANRGASPEAMADLIDANADAMLGPGTLDQLLALPDLQSRIEKAYPLAASQRDWWKTLIECLSENDGGESESTE